MIDTIMAPAELRNYIKGRAKEYLALVRQKSNLPTPSDQTVLHPKWNFMFGNEFRYLNFYPDIRNQVEDLLSGKVGRRYQDAASEIAVHDYIGHMASSQALCWNVVLPMKKYDFCPIV